MIAYVDPAAGLQLLPALLGLLAIAGGAILAVLAWPVTTLLRMIRGRKQPAATTAPTIPTDAMTPSANGHDSAELPSEQTPESSPLVS
jgi:hypothetical protein